MTSSLAVSSLLLVTVFSPLAGFACIALRTLLFRSTSERFVTRTARLCFTAAIASFGALLIIDIAQSHPAQTVNYVPWFSHGGNYFAIGFMADWLSLGFLGLTTLLAALVSRFSETYLHQEPGFRRFYLLFLLATFGMNLVVTSDNLGMTLIGWECLGISSALLIAFFHTRPGPVTNGFRAFLVYRIADVGLLLALLFAQSNFGEASFSTLPSLFESAGGKIIPSNAAFVLGALLFISAAGKSSILPFFPWLPRAMEGPTPSSAVFYGAFAVHAGPYLFLRLAPVVSASAALSAGLVTIGLLAAAFSALVGRTRPDVKTSLAYASMTQVSLVYAEIGCHWYSLAALHAAGHMCLRTYQFLRAPSALHDLHTRDLLGISGIKREAFYNRILPQRVQIWLYRLAFEEGGIAAALELYVISPFIKVAKWASEAERIVEHACVTALARGIK